MTLNMKQRVLNSYTFIENNISITVSKKYGNYLSFFFLSTEITL